MNITLLLIATCLIVSASLIGKLATLASSEKFLERHLKLLASFSAGVFVVVITSGITEASHELSLTTALVAALIGFVAVSAISLFIPEAHHHHSESNHHHSRRGVWKILLSDAIHNVVDGIALALAFSASTELGIAMAISIFAHEFVQELGEYFALRAYGLNQVQALWRNFVVACTMFVGIGIGLLVAGSGVLEPWMLAISAGTFLSVVLFDMLPGKLSSVREVFKHGAAALLGILLLVGIGRAMPHSHDAHELDHETHLESETAHADEDIHIVNEVHAH